MTTAVLRELLALIDAFGCHDVYVNGATVTGVSVAPIPHRGRPAGIYLETGPTAVARPFRPLADVTEPIDLPSRPGPIPSPRASVAGVAPLAERS